MREKSEEKKNRKSSKKKGVKSETCKCAMLSN